MISLKNYVPRESKCMYTIIFVIKYVAYNEVTSWKFYTGTAFLRVPWTRVKNSLPNIKNFFKM